MQVQVQERSSDACAEMQIAQFQVHLYFTCSGFEVEAPVTIAGSLERGHVTPLNCQTSLHCQRPWEAVRPQPGAPTTGERPGPGAQ